MREADFGPVDKAITDGFDEDERVVEAGVEYYALGLLLSLC